MSSYEEWLAAMPVDDVREHVAQLESELALLRPLLAHAPKSQKVRAPIPRSKTRTRRMSPERKAIIEIVRACPDGIAPAEVARRLGKLGGTVQAAMWRMANDKQLVSVGGLYTLPPTTPTDEDQPPRPLKLADDAQLLPPESEVEAMEP